MFMRAIAFYLLLISAVACLIDSAEATPTWGNLSVGKFYRYSVDPSAMYPDRWPVDIKGTVISDGSKLTDEIIADKESWPRDAWVGWRNHPVSITLDLGQVYAVSQISINACSQTGLRIGYPRNAVIWTSTDGIEYTRYGDDLSFPGNTGEYSTWTASNTGWVNARWIKYSLTPSESRLLVDEIQVFGTIPNVQKMVPESGCYHGAFPVNEKGEMEIGKFESLAGKSIKMALWYADWKLSFQNSIGYVADQILDGRYIEVGWLPENTTSMEIASGNSDEYLYNWLSDCGKRDYPTWIRPMNEMNGAWAFCKPNHWGDGALYYGGDPQSYRWAWRRMYNIAEQVGCTGPKQVFVWSPGLCEALPEVPESEMAAYYPGDQYTDWVGSSHYAEPPGGTSFASGIFKKWYDLYGDRKPLMIAEGGSLEAKTDPNWKGDVWMKEWFHDLEHSYPQVKASVWFHTGDYRIDTNDNSLARYREYVQNPYYLGK